MLNRCKRINLSDYVIYYRLVNLYFIFDFKKNISCLVKLKESYKDLCRKEK